MVVLQFQRCICVSELSKSLEPEAISKWVVVGCFGALLEVPRARGSVWKQPPASSACLECVLLAERWRGRKGSISVTQQLQSSSGNMTVISISSFKIYQDMNKFSLQKVKQQRETFFPLLKLQLWQFFLAMRAVEKCSWGRVGCLWLWSPPAALAQKPRVSGRPVQGASQLSSLQNMSAVLKKMKGIVV